MVAVSVISAGFGFVGQMDRLEDQLWVSNVRPTTFPAIVFHLKRFKSAYKFGQFCCVLIVDFGGEL